MEQLLHNQKQSEVFMKKFSKDIKRRKVLEM